MIEIDKGNKVKCTRQKKNWIYKSIIYNSTKFQSIKKKKLRWSGQGSERVMKHMLVL